MTDQDVLRESMERQIAAMPTLRGHHYGSPLDFVLREGTWFEAPTNPHKYEQGRPGHCYANAIALSVTNGLRYVEGFATNAVTPTLPIHHAWNLSEDGVVVDVTWGAYQDGVLLVPIGVAYVGVVFDAGRADEATWFNDATILDDWVHDWPILREPWQGETPGKEWPRSPLWEALVAREEGRWSDAYRWYEQAEREAT